MTVVKFKGIPIDIGGEQLVCPPMSLGAMEQMEDRLKDWSANPSAANIGTVIDCAYAALRRNYPDISREQVADGIDLGTMGEVMMAVMDVSGVERKRREAEALGEALAPSNGANSMPT